MFGSLFDTPMSSSIMASTYNSNLLVTKPPSPRSSCDLSGIENQGATCYLNSLLQTLLFTPEFREGLFKLSDGELGSIEDRERGEKVRIIPLQLQRLFTRLLLVDQQVATTSELTDSFGWTNNEELQQHDVQELNRILFSAIESSLVGTSGKDLISQLYHGTTVTEIVCQVCGKISEKEEDFFDLNVVVANCSGLEESLSDTFLQTEIMKGKNQYRCSTCCTLVDAKRGIKIRCLPPILTFSLSRFSYDIVKGERYKETGKFVFPMEIDMSSYCDKVQTNTTYDLFSVVIHSGSSYGGHYHAYIRDVDHLGKWYTPDDDVVVLTSNKLVCDKVQGPLELIKKILTEKESHCLSIDALCKEISSTGQSWNKRFKGSYGPITKFLQKHSEIFYLNTATNMVTLKDDSENLANSDDMNVDSESPASASESGSPRELRKTPAKSALKLFDRKKVPDFSSYADQKWFDFNDSAVYPIHVKEIEKQYSGKESAYMLFYRSKSLFRPPEAKNNPCYMMPEKLVELSRNENNDLKNHRELYENAINTIAVQLLLSDNYVYDKGALQVKDSEILPLEISLDRRKTLLEACQVISEYSSELVMDYDALTTKLYIAKELPAGLHLHEELHPSKGQMTLKELGVADGAKIFLCTGDKVDGITVSVGAHCEPVLLNISATLSSGEIAELTTAFPKHTTLAELKLILCDLLPLNIEDILVSKSDVQGEDTRMSLLLEDQNNCSLGNIPLVDGDNLVIESHIFKKESMNCNESVTPVTLFVHNLCMMYNDGESTKCQVIEITVDPSSTISELKKFVLSKISLDESKQYRLRKCFKDNVKRPPLHENETVKGAGLIELKNVILEEGVPPYENELTLTFSVRPVSEHCPCFEVNVNKNSTVHECLKQMCIIAGLSGDSWYLQRTNWYNEPMEILLHENKTLESESVQHGEFFLLSPGRAPPKGYLKFSIWLHPTIGNINPHLSCANGVLYNYSTLFKSLSQLLGSESGLVRIGDIELSGESTVIDLKKQILTLPALSTISLPNSTYLRLRLLEGNKPSKVIRGLTNTLRKLKLQCHQSLCIQLLEYEEELTVDNLLLNVRQRLTDTKSYTPPMEFIWNTSSSASPRALKESLAESLQIPIERLTIAKHFPDKFQWLIVDDGSHQKKPGKSKWSSGKKSNVRYSPYFLRDGDTLGVKDEISDPSNTDDFMTQEDIEGQEILKVVADGKRQRRQTRNSNGFGDYMLGGGGDVEGPKYSKTFERGITIHVDDFR